MMRNILCQSVYQLALLFTLMFAGPGLFGIKATTLTNEVCARFHVEIGNSEMWSPVTLQKIPSKPADGSAYVTCTTFKALCSGSESDPREKRPGSYCLEDEVWTVDNSVPFKFNELNDFEETCLSCSKVDYTHGSIIFNSFIWCQIFNEYSSRSLFDDVNIFRGLTGNYTFLIVSLISIGAQVFLIEVGGVIVKTSHLNVAQWFITIALGAGTIVVGFFMRFIPVKEDPNTFFVHAKVESSPAAVGVNKDLIGLV